MSYQQLTIVGNAGADAQLHYTAQGIAVCNFNVAVNKVTGKGDNRREAVTWFRVTCWRELAEIVAQYVKKGGQVLVVGEVAIHTFERSAGSTGASLEVTADTVKFLSSTTVQQPEPEISAADIPF